MRIHTDRNGLAVNAISRLADGRDVEGHHYQVLAGDKTFEVQFQNGPVPSAGVNGLTNEAALAILIHRTEFLNAKFPCEENEQALAGMRAALAAFESRTEKRLARGVEGREVA